MNEVRIIIFYSTILLLTNCSDSVDKKVDCDYLISKRDTLAILRSNNQYDFIEGNNYDFVEFRNGKSWLFFDKVSSNLESFESRNDAGLIVNYTFENNELVTKVSYYENDKNQRSSSEVIEYKNGIPNESESAYLNADIISVNTSELKCKISFRGAYSFLNGRVFFGEKIYDLSDTSSVMILDMVRPNQEFVIPRNLAKNGKLSLSVLIERGLNSEIPFRQTFPQEGEKSYHELYIKVIDLPAAMKK